MKFTKQIELAGESVTELMNIAMNLSKENSTQYSKIQQLRDIIAIRNNEVNKLTVNVDNVSDCNTTQCETINKQRKEIKTLMIINAKVTGENKDLRDMNRNQYALLGARPDVHQANVIVNLREEIDEINNINVSLQDKLDSANAKINTQFAELFETNAKLNRLSGLYNKNQKELRSLGTINATLIKEQSRVKTFFEGL